MKRNVCSLVCPIIGILIGISFILVGISLNGIAQDATFYPAGYGGDVSHLGSKEYGADYYSDSYQAMAFGANAAKNVFDLLSIALPAFLCSLVSLQYALSPTSFLAQMLFIRMELKTLPRSRFRIPLFWTPMNKEAPQIRRTMGWLRESNNRR